MHECRPVFHISTAGEAQSSGSGFMQTYIRGVVAATAAAEATAAAATAAAASSSSSSAATAAAAEA